jgi:ribosomal protein S18 acetylase RimI-like enzyme
VLDNQNWARLRTGSTWHGRRLFDKGTIERIISGDLIYGAYALGDLDPSFFEQTSWYGAQIDGEWRSLILLFRGLNPPALFLMGDSSGLALILGSLVRERDAYITCRPEHQSILEAYYTLGTVELMTRMLIRPEQFRPNHRYLPDRLTLSSIEEVRHLYMAGEGAVAFSACQLAQGCFYGIRQDGCLVAVAGTHLVSDAYAVGAVGNVFTHPAYRNRGYAASCTSAVVEGQLRRQVRVVLNVKPTNHVAMRVYRGLGFADYCPFIETPVVRRTLL